MAVYQLSQCNCTNPPGTPWHLMAFAGEEEVGRAVFLCIEIE
jgi:hypothetical protein